MPRAPAGDPAEVAAAAIRATFVDAGVRGWLHACRVGDPGTEVAVDPDVAAPLASVYKLVVLAAYARAVDAGTIEPTEAVALQPGGRTPGPSGVSLCQDLVTMSWRDLVASMVTVSDNAAADAVVGRLGHDAITEAIGALGLHQTTFTGGTAESFRALMDDTGTETVDAALAAISSLDLALEPSGYDPLRTSASTPRDLTTLLCALWDDTAASAAQCAEARRLLGRRFGQDRLRSGFAVDGVEVADKTGTLGALRHDVGVVRYAGEDPVAVAVLTRAARAAERQPLVDIAVGVAAHLAVEAVRELVSYQDGMG